MGSSSPITFTNSPAPPHISQGLVGVRKPKRLVENRLKQSYEQFLEQLTLRFEPSIRRQISSSCGIVSESCVETAAAGNRVSVVPESTMLCPDDPPQRSTSMGKHVACEESTQESSKFSVLGDCARAHTALHTAFAVV